jgi:hypothetical protein
MSLIKEAVNYYKARKQEEIRKRTLLSNKSDWTMLEAFVRQCNNNPNLKVEIILKDNTHILMKTYEEKKPRDFESINGADYSEIS